VFLRYIRFVVGDGSKISFWHDMRDIPHSPEGHSLKSKEFFFFFHSHDRHYILKSILKQQKELAAISEILQQIGQSPTGLSINI
jgi:hypothetical protein